MVLGLGNRASGGGRCRGGAGFGGLNSSYVMDSQKDEDVILIEYKCFLLRPISTLGGAFKQVKGELGLAHSVW